MLTPQRAHCVHSRPLTQVSELGGGGTISLLTFLFVNVNIYDFRYVSSKEASGRCEIYKGRGF